MNTFVRLSVLDAESAAVHNGRLARFVFHYLFFLAKLGFSLWGAL